MHITAVHLSKPGTIRWRGKEVKTGIFKYPVSTRVVLTPEGVEGDYVADKVHHGGRDKAFYLYPSEHYAFWRKKYPKHQLDYGMFGENITSTGMFENQVRCGNVYKLGGGLVKAIQPRQPCYKLGAKFGDQGILKEFIAADFPGIYFQVLENCRVEAGESLQLLEENPKAPTIVELFRLIYTPQSRPDLTEAVLENTAIPDGIKKAVAMRQGIAL